MAPLLLLPAVFGDATTHAAWPPAWRAARRTGGIRPLAAQSVFAQIELHRARRRGKRQDRRLLIAPSPFAGVELVPRLRITDCAGDARKQSGVGWSGRAAAGAARGRRRAAGAVRRRSLPLELRATPASRGRSSRWMPPCSAPRCRARGHPPTRARPIPCPTARARCPWMGCPWKGCLQITRGMFSELLIRIGNWLLSWGDKIGVLEM